MTPSSSPLQHKTEQNNEAPKSAAHAYLEQEKVIKNAQEKRWEKKEEWSWPWKEKVFKIQARIGINGMEHKITPQKVETAQKVVEALNRESEAYQKQWSHWLKEWEMDLNRWNVTPEECEELEKNIELMCKKGFKKETGWGHPETFKELNLWKEKQFKRLKDLRDSNQWGEQLGLKDYPQMFPKTRKMNRTFDIYTGPTNSGKTYTCMQALKSVKKGLYLAPLRLLALEGYQTLNDQNVACSMVTGEDRKINPQNTHMACTIEMAPLKEDWDMCVIDECQMIMDKDRGWAWTAAICGVAAKKVALVCAPEAVEILTSLLERLGESYQVHRFERKNQLVVEKHPWTRVEKGDAFVVFSRKQVLALRDYFVKKKKTVAVIYGALAPEVRQKEAAKFANGEVDIVIATDAIGMGLNLPIQRIIFWETSKFDGVNNRMLESQEVKQIAGRAGRYGLAEEGKVTSLSYEENQWIDSLLKAPIESLKGKLKVSPTDDQVELLSCLLKTERLSMVLTCFSEKLLNHDETFEADRMDSLMDIAYQVDGMRLDMKTKFIYAKAPVDHRSMEQEQAWKKWMHAHQAGKEVQLQECLDKASHHQDPLLYWETRMKICSAYLWLSFHFNDHYSDQEWALNERDRVALKIEELLEKANHPKDYVEERKKRKTFKNKR